MLGDTIRMQASCSRHAGGSSSRLAASAAAIVAGLVLLGPVRADERAVTDFREEFAGPQLDRTRWNVIVTGRTVNNEQQAYVDAPDVLYIRDGMLVIHPRFRPGFKTPEGRSFDFISGRIDTRDKFSFTYGTAAARMKLAAGAGLWPAFWALGAGRWPDTGEIDIMENVGDAGWTSVALHGPGYFGNTPLVRRTPLPSDADAAAWHVYAVDWTADALAFSVDGREFYRVTRPMVEKFGAWSFDNPKHLILNLALGGNYPAGVNKIETPYHGLAESTVKAIQRDEARILVDWVRVTAR
jgi:beta-glucanase (GH16 family)